MGQSLSKYKTITILGATSDLGRELAYRFAKECDTLILSSRNPKRLGPLRKDLLTRQYVDKVELIALDVFQDEVDILKGLTEKTDLLIITIGYLGDHQKALTDKAETHRIVMANYASLAAILNVFALQMEKRKSGGIIGVSSVAGDRGRQSNYIYGSAKAGFTAFLDGLRHRLYSSGIHVMTVLPGFMDTKMTAHLDLPKPLTASPQKAANLIYKAWNRKRNKIYVLPLWRFIMWIIRNIPEFVFKRTKM